MGSPKRAPAVAAVSFIRKVRGGAQAHLLLADDDHSYVVKFQNNPQGRRTLINELIATEILHDLGISTPEYRLVELSREFLDANPAVYLEMKARHRKVLPGIHFGSRWVADPHTETVFDFVPDALLGRVRNLKHFRGALVFDRWVSNSDRQCVYRRTATKRPARFAAFMIDQGQSFGGESWEFVESNILGLYPRRIVYESVRSIEDFEPWLSRAVAFPAARLARIADLVPAAWLGTDEDGLERLFDHLTRRQGTLSSIVESSLRPLNDYRRFPVHAD